MRSLYFIIVLAAGIAGYFFYKPEDFTATQQYIASQYNRTFIEKKITVRGLRTLRAEAIHARLPASRSIPWWIMNRNQIEAILTQTSFIQEADIQPCESWFSSWGCFVIDISERSPAYLTTSGSDMLVLGDDGAVIVSFPLNSLEERLGALLDPAVRKPILLVDMITPGVSSDVVKARFAYLSQAIATIEREGGVGISRVQLLPNGEIVVRLASQPFDVQFDSPQENPDRLADEAQRLRRLLLELKGKEASITRIDLAYDKLAVVTYTDEYLKQQAALKLKEQKK